MEAADASVSATLKGPLDFDRRTITIGKAKTPAGTGRIIPMNDELVAVMASHAERFTETFGDTRADHCVFSLRLACPERSYAPTVEIKTASNTIRMEAIEMPLA